MRGPILGAISAALLAAGRAIVANVYWSVKVLERYDSDPPPGLENGDLGVAGSIGRSF